MTTGVPDAIERLTSEEPSYNELVALYNELRTGTGGSPQETVSRRALAEVVREMIEYLDFAQGELEKSVGVTRAAERQRILGALDTPADGTPVQRVSNIVEQWEAFDQYTLEEIEEVTKHSPAR